MTDYSTTSAHRSTTTLINVVLNILGVFAGIIAYLIVSRLIDGGWGIVAGLFAALLTFGVVVGLTAGIVIRRREAEFAMLFPGYTGVKVPTCWFLAYGSDRGAKEYGRDLHNSAVGDGGDLLFFLRRGVSGGSPHSTEDMKLVDRLGDYRPLTMPKRDIVAVQLTLFSDASMEASKKGDQSTADKVIETGVGLAFGMIRWTSVTPFAGIVSLVGRRDGPLEWASFAVPDSATLDAMFAFEKKDEKEAARARVREIVAGIGASGGQISGLFGEGDEMEPRGEHDRARQAALLVAEQLRALAGLPDFTIEIR